MGKVAATLRQEAVVDGVVKAAVACYRGLCFLQHPTPHVSPLFLTGASSPFAGLYSSTPGLDGPLILIASFYPLDGINGHAMAVF